MRRSERAAAVILAHGDPAQVRRLIVAMEGFAVFLHCDRATPDDQLAAMVQGLEGEVELLPRVRTTISSWSLMRAELAGVRAALEQTDAEHVVVMSGSCYPIVAPEELFADLEALGPRSWMQTARLPQPLWNTWRNRDGGYWRLRRRFVVINDQVVHVRGFPLRTVRQQIPSELVVHGGLAWKVYARHHAQRLLAVLDEHPELVDFFRHTFIPEETCVATILQSPELVGPVAEEIMVGTPWYIHWPTGKADHPYWLTTESFEHMKSVRGKPGAGLGPWERFVFARKLRSAEAELLNRIDIELRGRDPQASAAAMKI